LRSSSKGRRRRGWSWEKVSLREEEGDNELTRMRCVSGVSLEVMWSAILLWKGEVACDKGWWFDAGGVNWRSIGWTMSWGPGRNSA
jgi:hypothetical protein